MKRYRGQNDALLIEKNTDPKIIEAHGDELGILHLGCVNIALSGRVYLYFVDFSLDGVTDHICVGLELSSVETFANLLFLCKYILYTTSASFLRYSAIFRSFKFLKSESRAHLEAINYLILAMKISSFSGTITPPYSNVLSTIQHFRRTVKRTEMT